MRLLLDTNVYLWLQTNRRRVEAGADVLYDATNELYLSAASVLEIAIKYGLGKLPLPSVPERYVPDHSRAIGALELPVEQADALAVASLPMLHADPFDRLLIAQARVHGMTLITGDPKLVGYEADILLV